MKQKYNDIDERPNPKIDVLLLAGADGFEGDTGKRTANNGQRGYQ